MGNNARAILPLAAVKVEKCSSLAEKNRDGFRVTGRYNVPAHGKVAPLRHKFVYRFDQKWHRVMVTSPQTFSLFRRSCFISDNNRDLWRGGYRSYPARMNAELITILKAMMSGSRAILIQGLRRWNLFLMTYLISCRCCLSLIARDLSNGEHR